MNQSQRIKIGLLISNSVDSALLDDFLKSLGYQVVNLNPAETPSNNIGVIITDEIYSKSALNYLHTLKTNAMPFLLSLVVLLQPKSDGTPWIKNGFDDIIRLPISKAELSMKLSILSRLHENTNQRYQIVFENISTGIYLINKNGQITLANSAFVNLLGYHSADEILNKNFADLNIKFEPPRNETDQLLQENDDDYQHVSLLIRPDDVKLTVRESIKVLRDPAGNILSYLGAIEDISEIIESKKLTYVAYHDVLTGLQNRAKLVEEIDMVLSQAARHNEYVGVLFIDIDHFKNINDTLGHDAGDQLLQKVAKRMQNKLRKSDLIIRLGGDEFIAIITQANKAEVITQVAEKILQSFEIEFTLPNKNIKITASIGVAIYPKDGEDSNALLKNADTAMYSAKEKGRNNIQFY